MPWNRRYTIAVLSRVGRLVHHSVRGVLYVSIKYTERLAEAGVEPSIGSVGDSYDKALAEMVIGLFKTGAIHRRGPWRGIEAVEFATLEWVHWFNRRLVCLVITSLQIGQYFTDRSGIREQRQEATLSIIRTLPMTEGAKGRRSERGRLRRVRRRR